MNIWMMRKKTEPTRASQPYANTTLFGRKNGRMLKRTQKPSLIPELPDIRNVARLSERYLTPTKIAESVAKNSYDSTDSYNQRMLFQNSKKSRDVWSFKHVLNNRTWKFAGWPNRYMSHPYQRQYCILNTEFLINNVFKKRGNDFLPKAYSNSGNCL